MPPRDDPFPSSVSWGWPFFKNQAALGAHVGRAGVTGINGECGATGADSGVHA